MSNKITIRKGLFADTPVLDNGEMGLTTDLENVYIGASSGDNILLNPITTNSNIDGYRIDGYLNPAVDNVHGLGTSSLRWNNIVLSPGSLHIESLAAETSGTPYKWGIHIDVAGDLVFSQSGGERFALRPIASTGNEFRRVLLSDGTEPLPSYTFTSDTDVGFYRPVDDGIGIVVNGVEQLFISDGYVNVKNDLSVDDILSVEHNITFTEHAAPVFASGVGKFYVSSSDNNPRFINSSGTDINLNSGGDVSETDGFNGADGYVAFWTGPNAIAGDNDFFFDRPTNTLQITAGGKFHSFGEGANSLALGQSVNKNTAAADSIQIVGSVGADIIAARADGVRAILIGPEAQARAEDAISIGSFGLNSGARTIWIGSANSGSANPSDCVIIGRSHQVVSTSQECIALGNNNFINTNMDNSIAFGSDCDISSNEAISIGWSADIGLTSGRQICIGPGADANRQQAIAIGRVCNSNANEAIVIGHTATTGATSHINSIALGQNAATTAANQLVLGTATEFVDIVNHGGITVDGYTSIKGSNGLAVDGQIYQTHIPSLAPTALGNIFIDFNTGAMQEIDLDGYSGTATAVLNNPKRGASYIVKVIQGVVTSDIDWSVAGVIWASGVAPVITAADDSVDLISLSYDGTTFVGTFSQDFG